MDGYHSRMKVEERDQNTLAKMRVYHNDDNNGRHCDGNVGDCDVNCDVVVTVMTRAMMLVLIIVTAVVILKAIVTVMENASAVMITMMTVMATVKQRKRLCKWWLQ